MKYCRRKLKKLLIDIRNVLECISQKIRSRRFASYVKQCGEKLELFGKPNVVCPQRLIVGNSCKINDCVYINARSGVTIGDNVTLSYGAKIISTGYDIDTFFTTGERVHREDTMVLIGDYVWICADAIILPGVKISGHHVIVAAGAVVTKDINDSYVIVAGNPAQIVKREVK